MTPKEKAKELVELYDNTLTYLESKSKAKQCALIAVDEVLNELDLQNHILRFYWYDVQHEINQL